MVHSSDYELLSSNPSGGKFHLMTESLHRYDFNEPAHDKTFNKTCVISRVLDQPVCPLSMASIPVYPSLDSLEAVEGMCNQQRC